MEFNELMNLYPQQHQELLEKIQKSKPHELTEEMALALSHLACELRAMKELWQHFTKRINDGDKVSDLIEIISTELTAYDHSFSSVMLAFEAANKKKILGIGDVKWI